MRTFCNVDATPRNLVSDLGTDLVVSALHFVRRDAAELEFQPFQGRQSAAVPLQLASNFEIRFTAKYPGDWNGDPAIFDTAFAWKPLSQLYSARPSCNTQQLRALFCGALGGYRYGAARTIDSGDLNRFVIIDSVSTVPATLPNPNSFNTGSRVWIIAATGTVTITAGAGATLADPSNLASVPAGSIVLATRTNSTTWTLTDPGQGELESVTLMGEFTWRNLSSPNDWTSTERFNIIVTNDVNRGTEGVPVDAGSATEYVKKSELDSALVRTDIDQTLDNTAKTRVLNNIGALPASQALTFADQDLTGPQQDQVRENIAAASQTDLEALDTRVDEHDTAIAALEADIIGKASAATVSALTTTVSGKALASDLAALSAAAIKKTEQTLTEPEKLQARTNIGAAADSTSKTRQATRLNAIGAGSTVPTLDGALHVTQGTPTARPVSVAWPLYTFAMSGVVADQLNATGHPFSLDTPVMVESTGTLPAPLAPWTWYYARDTASGVLKVAATPGGAAIDITSTGSGTHKIGRAASTIYAQQRRFALVSAATVGSSCGTRHNALAWNVSSNTACGRWTYAARFGISDAAAVANARLFVGLLNTTALIGNVNPSTLFNLVGIGADTGDTTLHIIHNDASGSATKVNLGSGFPANTQSADMIELQLVCANDGASVAYTVKNLCTGNTTSGTITTNLPPTSALLAPQMWRNNGTTALAVALDVVQWSMETAF